MGTKTLISIVICAVIASITFSVIYCDTKPKYTPKEQSTAMHRFVTIDSVGMWYFGESFITSDCPPLNIDGYKCIRVEYGTNSKYYIYAKTK